MTQSIDRSIRHRFAERQAEGRATLIPYLTAGFPSPSLTLPLMEALHEAGADILELGIPFSDPVADGPTIQRTSFEALKGGMTVAGVLSILRAFRARHGTPVVLFTYLNPVLHYGFERFLADAREAGADGLLLTDLPAGADPGLEGAVVRSGLDLIRLLAPTTAADRISRVADGGSGFLYYISRSGVTGARSSLRSELAGEVGRLRSGTGLPIAVGFGISSPDQAAEVAGVADGVVVGSALMQALEQGGVEGAAAFLGSLREAIDAATGARAGRR